MKHSFKKTLILHTFLDSSETIMFNKGGAQILRFKKEVDFDSTEDPPEIFNASDYDTIEIIFQLDESGRGRTEWLIRESFSHKDRVKQATSEACPTSSETQPNP